MDTTVCLLLACLLSAWFISPQESIEKATLFQGLQYVYNICVNFFRVLSREGNGKSFFFFFLSIDFVKPFQEEKEATAGGQYHTWRTKSRGEGTFLFTAACSGLYTTGYIKASTNASSGFLLTNEMWEYFPDCHLKQNFCKALTLGCGTVDHSVTLALCKINYVHRRMKLEIFVFNAIYTLHNQ